MGWDVGIHRRGKENELICVVRYQRSKSPDMGEVLFDHPDVYDPESCLGNDGTFIPDIAFRPNWPRLRARLAAYLASVTPESWGYAAYRELLEGVDRVLTEGTDGVEMHIG